ncbi:hypothetical protein CORC01_00934 [Colletotrichum orchidophilum]|uniref:NACHT domain-containing protein n=1 Tax=Colletotrichum orchidophilum TaxID=1209926 RepID=A0A1G4BQK5_9PEZI|nr:uncharacterized protein CORC01_00934 [Colletotrichum orchidophilum]OHF03615.1 hypothetical protein CORC01_00934 [Colletotrichum orchidophilum]
MASQSGDEAVVIDRDDVSNYNPEHILPEPPEVIQKLRAWLKPTSYDLESSEYHKHLSSHAPGTGEWLTNSQSYKDWLLGEDTGLLWIKGIPGSGKSVLASSIVKELSANNPGCPILYFFFRQIIDANHEPVALLRDWLDQVLVYSPPLQKKLKGYVVKEGYRDKTRSLATMSMQDLWEDLRLAFSGLPGKVYCVADALDEMDRGNDAFLQALAELGSWSPGKIKVLITSRPVPAVEGPLRHAKGTQIRLQETVVDADISTFVRRGLKTSNIPHNDQQLIQEAIPGRANGLFLYAKLAMDAFLERGANIKAVLRSLPADMNQMYTDLLHEHSRRSGVPDAIQRLILQWVTHATRPLRLLEIAEMINVTYNDIERDLKATKDLVRAACGPLLEILPDETVCVIHHSFTEYLKGTTRSPDDDGGYPVLHFGETQASLGSACLTYLLSGVFDETKEAQDTKDIKVKLKYPFLAYALRNWHVHIARSTTAGHDQTDVNMMLDKLMRDPGSTDTWIKLQWFTVGNADSGITPLHVAAKTGLLVYTRHLLSSPGVNVDAVDVHGKTPLWSAASSGMADVVQVLIDAGANPDQEETNRGCKPLHEAASKNYPEVIKVLLGAGVDPLTKKTKENPGNWCGNAPRSTGHTPLMYACQNGHLEALEAFLPFLRDEEALHRALAWSAAAGRDDLVRRLLKQPGVSINRKVHGGTPLFMASRSRHIKTIKLLLKEGADPTTRCEFYEEFAGFGAMRPFRIGDDEQEGQSRVVGLTALYAALENYYGRTAPKAEPDELKSLLELFIEKGADIHDRSPSGNSLLHVTTGDPVWLRILLDAGVDANVANSNGCTALHEKVSVDCLSLLVEVGKADINKRAASTGKTPLLLSLVGYYTDTTLKLIEYGADCTIVDNDGNGPLHISLKSSNSNPEIIEALLRAGADINLRNKSGETPLDVMFSHNSGIFDLMNVMIRAGVDINARDKDGATFLLRTISGRASGSEKDYQGAITKFLERGALLEARDFEGRTLLHEVIKSEQGGRASFGPAEPGPSRFEFLVSLGLDIDGTDYQGNTLLHELCWRINTDYNTNDTISMLKMLLNLGLDVNRPNNRGRTPLHRLCTKTDSGRGVDKEESSIDLVISHMKDINVRDKEGIAPLHLAVTASEYLTKKLLDAGADPTIETYEGLTPLHLAARSRQGNIVGMLLDALCLLDSDKPPGSSTKQGDWLKRSSARPITGVNAAANETIDGCDCTPLYYACLSGRPEVVSMLLEAGADVKGVKLRSVVTGFEGELELWRRKVPHDTENGACGGLTKGDLTRPYVGCVRDGRHKLDPLDDTARLEEIIQMVLDHGADLAERGFWPMDDRGYGSMTDTTSDCRDYALKCLSDASKKQPLTSSKVSSRRRQRMPTFDEKLIPHRREAISKALREPGVIESGKANENLFITRLRRREYDVMEELFKLGVDFLAPHMNHGLTNLGTLVKGGFTSLVNLIGLLEAQKQVEKGIWPAPDEATQLGFGRNKTWIHDVPDYISNEYRKPFLLQAVHQELPMLDMVCLLVEKFGVDMNELHGEYKQTDDGYELDSPTDSALHSLAKGHHWWHVAQALPYLISKGADLEVKNFKGQTPLHMALSTENDIGLFHKDAARHLILGGADVNAVDETGRSCLSYARGEVDMARFLVEHGATVQADAIFSAINEKQPDVLDALLSAGGDANIRLKKNYKKPWKIQHGRFFHTWTKRDLPDAEWYPLHHVAAKSGQNIYDQVERTKLHKAALKLIHVLLSHGADPFATFVRCKGEDCYHKKIYARRNAEDRSIGMRFGNLPDGYASTVDPDYAFEPHLHEESVVLHQLLADGQIVHPFLKLPNINANHRDGNGQTLLLAACRSTRGPDVPLTLLPGDPWDSKTSTETSLFHHLVSLGADVEVQDNEGQNVLHHMLRYPTSPFSQRIPVITGSLTYVLENHPSIVNQKDQDGKTPLYLAIERAFYEKTTTAANALLKAGADPLIADKEGNTVLHVLSRMLWVSPLRPLFTTLLQRGCEVNARNSKGETPLFWYYAGFRGNWYAPKGGPEIYDEEGAIAAFEAAGADFGARDDAGQSLLHVAAEGHVARFKTLTAKGLDPMLEDHGRKTPVDVAAACGNKGVLRLFKRVDAADDDDDDDDDESVDRTPYSELD